jgi:hypothetical protein
MKKRCLILVLTLALLLSACGSPAKSDVSGSIRPAETVPAETERPVSMGRLEGGIYTNSYAGFGCNLDSSWTYYSAEELQELPENTMEMFKDSELMDSVDALNYFTDMMAENVDALTTMNVLYQKLSLEERMAYAMLEEGEILEQILAEMGDEMSDAYAQAGFLVESAETVTVTFLGQERTALKTAYTMEGVPYFTLQLFDFGLGQYSITLTLASFVEDRTADMLELFYAVE